MRSVVRLGLILLFVCFVLGGLQAQMASGTLRGQVIDPSGAVVTGATVTATGANGKSSSVISNSKGNYEIKGLAPGSYALHSTAKGFAAFDTQGLAIQDGAAQTLDISLAIAVERQQVKVDEESAAVSTDSASNASAVVITGKDLDALSDDPDDLQSDLEALAGPSAGPNGGQIYIDGFSNGTLPPKSAIREIRINQNPFSAQYDRLGFGRIEVFTKPGQEKFHGQFQLNTNYSAFNSLNPFLKPGTSVPDYHTWIYESNFGGPINKKSSFFLSYQRRNIDEVSIVNAAAPCPQYLVSGNCLGFDWLDTTKAWQKVTMAEPNPRIQYEFSPRIDYQVSANNTLTARYQYENVNTENGGVGGSNLPSRASNSSSYQHEFRISDTQIINPTMINETRLQVERDHSQQKGLFATFAESVQDLFSGGGSTGGNSTTDQRHLEFQNYTSKTHGNHFVRFGGRVRVNSEGVYSLGNPYGSFVYRDEASYQGGTPMKFTITTGNPVAKLTQTDAGLYAEDDWRVAPKITVSYGLRFETQSNVTNRANFAPRFGIAWGLSPRTVLRAGFGMFYDRYSMSKVMNVNRTNNADPSMNQTNYLVNWTGAPNDPPIFNTVPSDLSGLTSTAGGVVYAVDAHLKLPYTMQVAVTLERQLSKTAKITASYITSRGLHQALSFCEEQIGVENVPCELANAATHQSYTTEYMDGGTFKQQQFMTNTSVRMGQYLSLFGWYTIGFANSNVSGGFPTDPNNLNADWGRSSFDVRQRAMIGGSVNLPYGIRLNPFIMASSGRPYNLTTGTDLNNDTDTGNDRPWFSNGCGNILVGQSLANPGGTIYHNSLGCFSADPTSASNLARVPVNYLTGPGSFVTNLRISKTFGFGRRTEQAQSGAASGGDVGRGRHGMPAVSSPRSGGGSRNSRYNLTFSASSRNLFNHVNPSTPSGNLSSANFGTLLSSSLGGSANRRVDFVVSFNF